MRPRKLLTLALFAAACSDGTGGLDGAVDVDAGEHPDAQPVRRDATTPPVEVPAPALDAITPSSGPETGGTRVTLRGGNFVEPAEVFFGPAPATNVVVLDSTSIAATAPAGPIGPVDVVLRTPGGEATLEDGYRFHRDLRVTSVTPARLPEEGGVPIVIEGKGFTERTLILFERRPAIAARLISAERIEAIAPALPPGRPEIYAAAPDADHRRSDLVIVYATPQIGALAPGYGPIAGGPQALQGQGFTGAERVRFGAAEGAGLTVRDDARLDVEAPALAEGAHDLVVANADASDTLVGGYVAYDPASPSALRILGATPRRASTVGGEVVAIVGYGFGADTSVSIGGRAAAIAALDGPYAVIVAVPPGLPLGAADVELSSGGSSVSLAGAIDIFAPVTLSRVRPARGPVGGGTRVTIEGSGLAQAGLELRLGGVPLANVTVVDDDQITAETVGGPFGAATLSARLAGREVTLRGAFTFEEDFDLVRIDPVEGSIAGNTLVFAFGRGFAGTASVTFARVGAASAVVENGSVIAARTRPTRSGPVDVAIGAESGRAELPMGYRFYDPRIITGGAWGGSVIGSVNVGVLGGNGMGVPGMVVQLGLDADPRYTAITDQNGLATISWPELRGPQTVTVGRTGFEFVTYPEIDARNLTMYTSAHPAPPPPDAPVEPCPMGGEPPKTGGKVFKFKSGIDPVTRPGWIPLVRITYSDASAFEPNPPDPPEQVDFVFEDGGEYEIVVMRGGTVALYAVLGDFNPETQEFIPRRMGIVRSVPAAPGQVLSGVNIPLDIELDRSISLRLDDPPRILPGPTLNAVFPFLNLGSDGVIPFDPFVVPEGATIPMTGLPNLPGANFYYMAGAFTDRGNGALGAPYSLTFAQSADDGTNGVDVGPFLRMPEDVLPKRGRVLERGRLSWAQPGIVPDATSVSIGDSTVVSGCCCIDVDQNGSCAPNEPQMCGGGPVPFNRWSLFGPGGLQSYPLPTMPPGVTAFEMPRMYQWVTQQAIAPRFDYREWILNQYSPYFWKSWAVSAEVFLAKEEAE